MIRTNEARRNLTALIGPLLVVGGGIAAAFAVSVLAGTKTGFVLALLSIGGPIFLYFAIVAPLVVPFGLYVALVPFDNLLSLSGFGTLTKVLGIVSGGALLFYLLRTRRALYPTPALLLWAAFTLWAATTAFWAMDPALVWGQLGTTLALVILYGAISVFPADANAVRWMSIFVIAGSLCAAAYGAYLFHNGTDIYYGTRLRITTDTGAIDPNQFAAAMLLPIALCLTTLLHTRKLLVAVGSLAALVLLFVGVTLSASRGAIIAIGLMTIWFFIRSRGRMRLVGLIGLVAAAIAPLAAQTALWDRFGEAMSTGGNGRMSIWRVGFQAIKHHFLLGAGYGNFPLAYDSVFLQTPHLNWADAAWHRGSHSLLVGTGVEVGFIGLGLLLAAWVAQFTMLREIPPDEPEYPMRVALEATIIGIFFAALFLDVMTFKYVWLVFMMIALVRNAHYLRRRGTHYA